MFSFKLEESVFPKENSFLGFDKEVIQENWSILKSSKIQTEDQYFKPYSLMEFKMKQPLDEHCANLFDESYLFRKIHLDYCFMINFAHPIPDPNCASLFKVCLVKVLNKHLVFLSKFLIIY